MKIKAANSNLHNHAVFNSDLDKQFSFRSRQIIAWIYYKICIDIQMRWKHSLTGALGGGRQSLKKDTLFYITKQARMLIFSRLPVFIKSIYLFII